MSSVLIKLADSVNTTDRNTSIAGNENGSSDTSVSSAKTPNMEKAAPGVSSSEEQPAAQPEPQGEPTPNIGVAIIDMFAQNDDIADSDFHAFAEQLGIDVHMAEQAAYKLAGIAARLIRGGKFAESGLTYDDLDPEQLQMGIEIEQEHTPDIEVATKITADHLCENPMYYSYLTEMESLAEEDMGGGQEQGQEQQNGQEQQDPQEEQGQVQATGTNNNSETPFQS